MAHELTRLMDKLVESQVHVIPRVSGKPAEDPVITRQRVSLVLSDLAAYLNVQVTDFLKGSRHGS